MDKGEHCMTCRDCVYFDKFEASENGECRRYPPTVIIDQSSDVFPQVDKAWWCGEFKQKENIV